MKGPHPPAPSPGPLASLRRRGGEDAPHRKHLSWPLAPIIVKFECGLSDTLDGGKHGD